MRRGVAATAQSDDAALEGAGLAGAFDASVDELDPPPDGESDVVDPASLVLLEAAFLVDERLSVL